MVLVAINTLEDGWPVKKQRLSLGLVGKMHRTASSVCTCVCMCGCTSRNLEGKKENEERLPEIQRQINHLEF